MDTQRVLPDQKFNVPVVGGDLAVFQYGAAGGHPILAIHGVTSSNRAWQLFADALIARGFTIYAVDLRGRGHSNALPGPFGMEVHAKDCLAVIDFFELEKLDVIGHSMGAFVAVALLGTAPHRIARTVLIDGGIPLPLPAGFTVEQVMPYILGPALARLKMTFESHDAYRDYWKVHPAFVDRWTSALQEYVDYDLQGAAPNLRARTAEAAVEQDSIDLFGNDLIERTLRELPEQVLLIRAVRGLQNEETPLYPEPVLSETLKKYPNIKVETIPDTNHYDILLSENGANACTALIYGSN